MKSKAALKARNKGIRQKAKVISNLEKDPLLNKIKHFSLRLLKYRKNRLLGMNRMDAGVAAGYSHSYMRTKSKVVEDAVKGSIIDELNRAGATDKVLARELTNLALNAVKIQSCNVLIDKDEEDNFRINQSNNDFIEVPDLHLRKDTLELIAKLKKHLIPAPLVDASEHTHLTVVVEGPKDEQRVTDPADRQTEFSLRAPV